MQQTSKIIEIFENFAKIHFENLITKCCKFCFFFLKFTYMALEAKKINFLQNKLAK